MDPLDRPALSPTDDTLAQSQVVLFAAALFLGCTIFDVQSARIDIASLLPRASEPATRQAVREAQPVAASFTVSAPAARQQAFLRTASLRGATAQRTAAACQRGTPQAAPASLHAWHKARSATAPAASLIALVD